MGEGRKIYPSWQNLPMDTAILACHPERDDVMSLCEMAQYRLLALMIGLIPISTEMGSDVSSTARSLCCGMADIEGSISAV